MKVNEAKEVLNIVKNEPFSILIIFSLLILPVIFLEWLKFFPDSLKLWVVAGIVILWVFALFRLRKELLIYRRQVILLNYLKKEKRHSFDHLSKEWIGKDEFSEKSIRELVKTYPHIFKFVKVKSGDENKDGVGLVEESSNENSKA